MHKYVRKIFKRVLVQLICVAVVAFVIALLHETADLFTFLIVPALAAATVWLSGVMIKGRCCRFFNDLVLISFFTTLTCSYAVTMFLVTVGFSCLFPNCLFTFAGALAGFYLPFVTKAVHHY